MKRLLPLVLLLPALAPAATISSAVCPGTGCSLSYVPSTPAMSIDVAGTWSGALTVELSADATVFRSARAYPVGGGAFSSTFTENGSWLVPTEGLVYLRVRATAWTSGTATVTLRQAPALGPVDVVRVVGPTFGEVAVSGTVSLDSATTSTLAAPVCSFASAPPVLTLTTTPQDTPATPLEDRTQLLVKNLSGVQSVWCCKGASCEPSSTAAYVILPGGDFQAFPARASDVVRCRSAVGVASVNVQEASCG